MKVSSKTFIKPLIFSAYFGYDNYVYRK